MKRITFTVSVAVLVFAITVNAQHMVGKISSPPNTIWNDMVLYETGGKIFISDNTNHQILVYDAVSLEYLSAISLSSFPPGRPQHLALHEGTGTLYVAVDWGYVTSDTTVVIINAKTYAVIDALKDIGCGLTFAIDEGRARLYTFGLGHDTVDKTLTAIDVNTNGFVGSLNIDVLMGWGSAGWSGQNCLNPVTGEIFFINGHYDKFVVVDGPTLGGQVISGTGSRGRRESGTWNLKENKLYITRAAWNGYFIYDRDTAASKIADSINDGTELFYSPASNRVYSGAEVNGDSTVIEGDTDAWQDIEIAGGLYQVGFVTATHHAYFAGIDEVRVLDEDILKVVDSMPSGRPGAQGLTDVQVAVSQSKLRVFVRNYRTGPDGGSCVSVIDDKEDDLIGTWDGQGLYYRKSGTGDWTKLGSPATLVAAGDLDGDPRDDLIGVFPTSAGVWMRSSLTGKWSRLSATSPKQIACGDMGGDRRDDLLATWDGVGVFYRDSVSRTWVKMAPPAKLVAAGDIDGDEKDDLIVVFQSTAGVWVKYFWTSRWAKLSSTSPRDIASADMNGDGRDDLVATWDGLGVFYRNSASGAWVKMAEPADQVTAGDLDGYGADDLIGSWSTANGVYVKYSKSGKWAKLSAPARDIATGLMSVGIWGSSQYGFMPLDMPIGGYAEDLSSNPGYEDLSPEGPGGWRFAFQEENNLAPLDQGTALLIIPGPGDPGFRWTEQENLLPQEEMETLGPKDRHKAPQKKGARGNKKE